MNTEIAEARALVAAVGKELSSVPPFELLELAQGLDLPEEAPADVLREEFLERSKLSPPRFLRVIDCQASVEVGEIVLIDWDIAASGPASGLQISEENGLPNGVVDEEPDPASGCVGEEPNRPDVNGEDLDVDSGVVGEEPDEEDDEESGEADHDDGYCAISHTYGMYVYEVFDCGCAAKCKAKVARADPAKTPCKGLHDDSALQQRVIGDILAMCQLLLQAAGVRYAWHDGVCIAQYDEEEVRHFIRHMGWIYANADSTIIFLHYIGRPMAPIGPGIPPFDLISRWQTRVWTFQEGALSHRRRYCVRTGCSLRECSNLREFEDILASWYEEGGSNSIEVLEEYQFWDLVEEMLEVLSGLPEDNLKDDEPITAFKVVKWINCLSMWVNFLASSCQSFPTIVHALDTCSSRESKHEGDRINSILALAGVQNFDAHKDNHVEQSTLDFFNKMGHSGLALALFTTNKYALLQSASNRKHTWFPTLSTNLMLTPKHTITREPSFHTEDIEFKVLDDGSLEVKGQLACIAVRFNLVQGGEANANGSTSGTGQSVINHELVVDLVNDQPYGSFRALAVFSNEDQPVELGSALLPTIERDSGGEMKSQSRDDNWVMQSWGMVEEWLHAVPKAAQSVDRERLHNLPVVDEVWQVEAEQILSSERAEYSHWGMMILPRNPHVQYNIDKEPARHFNAFIIFPATVLRLDFTGSSSHHNIEASSISAFLVQGDLHSKVTKIGCFIGRPALLSILQQHHPYAHACTFPNNLIVK